jgi:parallel beta-helix repeat protein
MMRRVLWFCVPPALLFALLPGFASAKTAAGPSCGATITKSIKLKANINCTGGGLNGLVVGKNGIVIDLNGYTITGAGGANHYYGIYNNGHNNVTVENGTIKNFYYDYYSEYAHHETVTKVTFVLDGTQSYDGLYAGYGGANTYSHNTVSNGYYGFYAYSEAGDTFTHNSLRHNDYAVYDEYSQHETWMSNDFSYSTDQGYYNDYGSPILIGNASSHDGSDGFYIDCDEDGYAVVKNNIAKYDGGRGIYSYYCYSSGYETSLFTGNTTNHDSYGIYSTYDWKAKFSGNTADSNSKNGFYFYEPSGYVITKNTSDDNALSGVLFYTNDYYYPHLFTKNSSSGNHSYGFESDYGLYGTHDTGKGNTHGLLYQVSG